MIGDVKHFSCPSTHDGKRKYIHTMEHYSVLKKKEILSYLTMWVNLKASIGSDISQE
jgi:hypothetical protein